MPYTNVLSGDNSITRCAALYAASTIDAKTGWQAWLSGLLGSVISLIATKLDPGPEVALAYLVMFASVLVDTLVGIMYARKKKVRLSSARFGAITPKLVAQHVVLFTVAVMKLVLPNYDWISSSFTVVFCMVCCLFTIREISSMYEKLPAFGIVVPGYLRKTVKKLERQLDKGPELKD